MRFRQVKDILEWTREFHSLIAQRLGQTSGNSERAKLLLEYFSDHEERLAYVVARFEEDADAGLLNSWFQDVTEFDELPSTEELNERLKNADENEVVKLVVHCHDQIIAAYKALLNESDIESVSDILSNLVQLEENEKMLLVRDSQYFQDV